MYSVLFDTVSVQTLTSPEQNEEGEFSTAHSALPREEAALSPLLMALSPAKPGSRASEL
jgi:hypothetical protein